MQLETLEYISDAQNKFYVHRTAASVVNLQLYFLVFSLLLSFPFAKSVDHNQLVAYSAFNDVPLHPDASSQESLRIKDIDDGFASLIRFLHAH